MWTNSNRQQEVVYYGLTKLEDPPDTVKTMTLSTAIVAVDACCSCAELVCQCRKSSYLLLKLELWSYSFFSTAKHRLFPIKKHSWWNGFHTGKNVTVINIYLGQIVHNNNRQKTDVVPLTGVALNWVFRMYRSIKVSKRFICQKTTWQKEKP